MQLKPELRPPSDAPKDPPPAASEGPADPPVTIVSAFSNHAIFNNLLTPEHGTETDKVPFEWRGDPRLSLFSVYGLSSFCYTLTGIWLAWLLAHLTSLQPLQLLILPSLCHMTYALSASLFFGQPQIGQEGLLFLQSLSALDLVQLAQVFLTSWFVGRCRGCPLSTALLHSIAIAIAIAPWHAHTSLAFAKRKLHWPLRQA